MRLIPHPHSCKAADITRSSRLIIAAAGLMALLGTMCAHAQPTEEYVDVGRGNVPVYIPSTYDDTPMPLIVLLHGYGVNGRIQEWYFQFRPHQDDFGFILTTPDGTVDFYNNHFWNATDACCDFFHTNVDDSTYILDLINAIKAQYAIDNRRVYIVGHSNGSYMAYRFACDHADVVAAIAGLAGAMYKDISQCNPANPVSVLHIHGTADDTVLYEGGDVNGTPYPGAIETTEDWAFLNGCSIVADNSKPPLDLDASLPGHETLVTAYPNDCKPGGAAELWTIVGGSHVPDLSISFSPLIIQWLLDHPKPCPGDFNGDNTTNTQDVTAFLNAWVAKEPAADFNNDSMIDTRDVTEFLNAWNAPCS